MKKNKLKELRKEIEKVDKRLIKTLVKREQIIDKVSEIKKDNLIPIVDFKREKEIIKRLKEELKLNKTFIEDLYEIIFKHSKRKQKNDRYRKDN